jgi:hypothetical protein
MLYVIRENYISREELINNAFKQYKYWSNLMIEEIKCCIKECTPNMNGIKLAKDASCVRKNFRKYFTYDDPDIYPEFEKELGLMHLEINQTEFFTDKLAKVEMNKWRSWNVVLSKTLESNIKNSNMWFARMKYFHKHRRIDPLKELK